MPAYSTARLFTTPRTPATPEATSVARALAWSLLTTPLSWTTSLLVVTLMSKDFSPESSSNTALTFVVIDASST
jgi:hypothetical protein